MDLRSGLIGPTVDNIICKVEIFMKLTINDVVRLDVDVPEEGLFAGDIGTVAHECVGPGAAYEGEFTDEDGRTLVQLTLLLSQISLATDVG